jgi:serine/threonine-protein kinase HipA
MINNLDVYLWGNKVGSLVAYRDRYSEKSCFYFDSTFLARNLDIAPLRASIKSVSAQNRLPIYAEEDKMFGGMPSFIADSLPDNWGNKVFAEWAKANSIRSHDITSLDRLAYIGRRGMGALEFIPPAAAEMESPFKVNITELYRLAQSALTEAKSFNASLSSDIMIQSLFKVGTSAGGRHPKAIINVNFDTMECYSGQVAAPAPGFTPTIIKFDEHGDVPMTRIEYSYYLMAQAAGLGMMPSRLIEYDDSVHFLTERFDRHNDKKIHIQTLAAMKPLANTYEELFDVAGRLGVGYVEMSRLFLLMVMNVLGANVDDHNKNFSFMMGPDGVWHIAPAYDYTFTVDTSAPWYVNRHSMTVNGKNSEITRADLLTVAKRFNIKRADATINDALKAVSNYHEYASAAGVDEAWYNRIAEEMARRSALIAE